MIEDDPRPATYATSTNALRAVAVLLALVLLVAAAMMALDALSTPRSPGGAAGPTEWPVRHQAWVDVQTVRTAVDVRL